MADRQNMGQWACGKFIKPELNRAWHKVWKKLLALLTLGMGRCRFNVLPRSRLSSAMNESDA
jgi:hypothetical protein